MTVRSESPSSSSRLSGSPSPQIVEKKKKRKSEGKDKSKQQTTSDGTGKNEGVDPNWDYAPPPGATLIEEDEGLDAGEFDWDRINDSDDLELWLIRIPDSVKPKYLDGLKVDIPTSSKSGRIGELSRKHATFDIWSIGQGNDAPVGGEEIKTISYLLPRKSKKGRLYPAPKPIARHIVFSAQEVKPTPDPNADPSTMYNNPLRHSYPKEVLKHRFLPYGAYPKNNSEEQEEQDTSKMVVDEIEEPTPGQPKASPTKKRRKKFDEEVADPVDVAEAKPEVVEKKSKGKKRKGESTEAGDTPATKKPKKSKAA